MLAAASPAQQYTMSTIAGGAPPATPAPGTSVSIGNPLGTAADNAGNAYFSSLNCVFRLDTHGVVILMAGTSRAGFSGDGGAAINAQLFSPNGLAVDSAGNVFIADNGNNRIRKVSNGVITTVAGGGSASPGDGGAATSATLQSPTGVAVDTQGNLYIADSGENRVRKVSTTGVISTIAGNGTAGYAGDNGSALSARLSQPRYVAVDTQGNVIISDTGNNRVRKVSASGTITTIAGNGTAGYSGDNGPGANAALNAPEGVAADSAGNVFVVDSNNERVREISLSGIITTVAGNGGNGNTGDGGPAISAQLNGSYGLALDGAGDLFLASYYSFSIREVWASGIITTVAGTNAYYSGDNGAAPSAQLIPAGVAVDSQGNIYVADNSRVRKVTPAGIITTVAGTGQCCGPGQNNVPATSAVISPQKVAADSSGNLYITDFFSVIHKVSASGTITTIAGNGTAGYGGDNGPAVSAMLGASPGGLAVDGAGNVFIADTANNRVRKVSLTGVITTVAGNGTAGFAGDNGPAVAAQLSQPTGVAVDGQGNLYIADTSNSRIRRVSAAGTITTVAGSGTPGYSGDGGPALNAQLQNPQSVAIDAQGNLVIADSVNNVIRFVSSSGVINTVGGNGSYAYTGDCLPGSSAELANPRDATVDGAGNILIADSDNKAIRHLQPSAKPTLVCSLADAASEAILPVTPGKIVVIYGTGMGPAALSVATPFNGAFGSQLAGTTVTFNGVAAPLLYTVAGQVSAIVPYETAGSAVAQINVSYSGQSSAFAVPVVAAAPSVFTSNGSGIGQAAVVNNADGTINSPANPAKIGSYIQIYATGEGQTSPAGLDGALAPLQLPLPAPILPVSVTVGGLPATVAYAGASPGAVAGLMQVNVQIPSGVTPGSAVPLTLQVGSASSGAGVTIAVSGN